MAITIVTMNRQFTVGPNRFQTFDWSAVSGATSGTVDASFDSVKHIMMLGSKLVHSAAPTFSGKRATLAFTVPAETAALKTLQSALLVTAVANQGAAGNSTTVAFTAGATAGSEVVTVTGTAISIQIQSGVSTATQVSTAFGASAEATALATMTIVSGHDTDTIATASATALAGGITGGARGTGLLIGV